MKNKIATLALLFGAIIFSSTALYSQSAGSSGSIKARIVHEEKTEKGKKSVYIDSEEKYDSKGNVIEEIEYKDGKIDKHMLYEYDSNNNKIKETELNDSGKPKKIGEYKYENGLRKEKYVYDGNKMLISKKTYTYKY